MLQLTVLRTWLRTRIELAKHDEGGFTAVEWLIIAIGVIAIAGIAVAAIRAYVTSQTENLNGN